MHNLYWNILNKATRTSYLHFCSVHTSISIKVRPIGKSSSLCGITCDIIEDQVLRPQFIKIYTKKSKVSWGTGLVCNGREDEDVDEQENEDEVFEGQILWCGKDTLAVITCNRLSTGNSVNPECQTSPTIWYHQLSSAQALTMAMTMVKYVYGDDDNLNCSRQPTLLTCTQTSLKPCISYYFTSLQSTYYIPTLFYTFFQFCRKFETKLITNHTQNVFGKYI